MDKHWDWRRNGLLANWYLFLKKGGPKSSWKVELQLLKVEKIHVCMSVHVYVLCMHVRDALWERSMVSGTHVSSLLLSSVQSLSRVQLFATPWTAAHEAFLSITISCSLLKLMSIESVMPSNHLILCRPLLLPPSIFPSMSLFK